MWEFHCWTEKALIWVKNLTFSWEMSTDHKSTISEKSGQVKCISLTICIRMLHSFGNINLTDFIKKFHFLESGSTWTNHQTLKVTNLFWSPIKFSKVNLPIWWQLMLISNIIVSLTEVILLLIGRFILIMATPQQCLLTTFCTSMEDHSSSVEATVWELENMLDIGRVITQRLGHFWDFPFQETSCSKFSAFKWSELIFAVSTATQLNNFAQDGLNLEVCILSQEIIIKTSPRINNLMLLAIEF